MSAANIISRVVCVVVGDKQARHVENLNFSCLVKIVSAMENAAVPGLNRVDVRVPNIDASDLNPKTSRPVVAETAADALRGLLSLHQQLEEMRIELAELRSNSFRRSSQRNFSCSRPRSRSRRRSNDVNCWYHRRFGARAKSVINHVFSIRETRRAVVDGGWRSLPDIHTPYICD